MSQQDGFGDNGTEPTGSTEPDDDNDRMQKKSENVAHAQDRIKLQKLKNSRRLRNSPTTPMRQAVFVYRLLVHKTLSIAVSSAQHTPASARADEPMRDTP